jgi:hypothetical protein
MKLHLVLDGEVVVKPALVLRFDGFCEVSTCGDLFSRIAVNPKLAITSSLDECMRTAEHQLDEAQNLCCEYA